MERDILKNDILMQERLYALLLLPLLLFAYSDSDMDGVEDSYDNCPGTLFSELVDAQGCTIRSLESPHHFNLIGGLSYGQRDQYTLQESDSLSSSLQLDYYYKRFSVQLVLSTYSFEEESGLNDTTLGLFYGFSLLNNLNLRLGAAVILPTYETGLNNEATDYTGSAELIYSFDDNTLFTGISHTLVKDKDVETIAYKDSNAFSFGYGHYFSSKFYASGAYYYSDGIYVDVESIQNTSAYMYYAIDNNLFTTFTYSYGLTDTANEHFVELRLGYYY